MDKVAWVKGWSRAAKGCWLASEPSTAGTDANNAKSTRGYPRSPMQLAS